MSVSPPTPHPPASEVAVDGHVHFHSVAHDGAALRAASRNFEKWCPVASRIGVLMLADVEGSDAYERLRADALSGRANQLRCTSEPYSLWAETDGWRLLIVAGRQIVTAERLEVLAVATRTRYRDGLPLEALVEQIDAEDAIAVLPWGCGKWLGKRGALVRRALERARPGTLFLGDNSGRPGIWPEPLFRAAAERNLRVLPGTDPLPLEGEWQRIGCFGFSLPVRLSAERPADDLKRALRDPHRASRHYGRLETFGRFIANQLRLRATRRHAPRSAVDTA